MAIAKYIRQTAITSGFLAFSGKSTNDTGQSRRDKHSKWNPHRQTISSLWLEIIEIGIVYTDSDGK